MFEKLAYLAIPFLLVTPLVTSILQIVLASEAIAKYNNTMHHFDGTDSAKGFSMIHDGNIFISASYPIVLCVFGCGWFVLLASAIGQRDDSVAVRCGTLLLFSTLYRTFHLNRGRVRDDSSNCARVLFLRFACCTNVSIGDQFNQIVLHYLDHCP